MRISTPEGVDVELTLAGIGSRFIAAIFDFVIEFAIILAAGFLLGVLGGDGSGWANAGVRDHLLPRLLRLRRAVRGPRAWPHARQALDRPAGRAHQRAAGDVRAELHSQRHAAGRHAPRPAALRGRDGLDLRDRQEPAARRPRRGHAGRARAPRRASGGGIGGGVAAARAADGWDVSSVSAQDIGTVRQFLERRETLADGPRGELARDLERRLRPRVAGAPEGLRAEEFLERLSAAKS